MEHKLYVEHKGKEVPIQTPCHGTLNRKEALELAKTTCWANPGVMITVRTAEGDLVVRAATRKTSMKRSQHHRITGYEIK